MILSIGTSDLFYTVNRTMVISIGKAILSIELQVGDFSWKKSNALLIINVHRAINASYRFDDIRNRNRRFVYARKNTSTEMVR